MKITKRTKTRDVMPLITTKEQIDSLLEQVYEIPYSKPLTSLKIKDFAEVVLDEEAYLAQILSCRRAYKALGHLKWYRNQLEQLSKIFKILEIPQSSEEKQAAIGVQFPDLIQRMLFTVTKFFGLKSFKEAEEVQVQDWILIAMDQTADVKYQRNYNKILENKYKQSRNGKHKL